MSGRAFRSIAVLGAILALGPVASASRQVARRPVRRAPPIARSLRPILPREVSAREIEKQHLVQIDGTKLGGTSRKALVEVGGQRYVFKMLAHNSTRLQRERFAFDVRRAAGDPTLQVFAREVPSQELGLRGKPGVVKGMLKPFIHNRGPLTADVKSWSRSVRASLLVDHAWAEFLGNYDLKTDTYLVLDSHDGHDVAMNVDLDASLSDYGRPPGPLTRFKSRGVTVPPQNLLYRAYVRGKAELDFRPMFDAVERIQGIDEQVIRDALAPMLEKAYADKPEAGEELVQAVLHRQRGLMRTFRAFVGDLEAERARRVSGGPRDRSWRGVKRAAADAAMPFAVRIVNGRLWHAKDRGLQLLRGATNKVHELSVRRATRARSATGR